MNKKAYPPRRALNFLLGFMDQEEQESFKEYVSSVCGEVLGTKGQKAARRWFWSQFIRSLPKLVINLIQGDISMLKNYLKIALRNFKRAKLYSFINIFGLAIGITCCILTLLYIQYELSYDKYHEHAEDIYRVIRARPDDLGPGATLLNGNPAPLAIELKNNFPEVISASRILKRSGLVMHKGSFISERNFFFVDPDFLKTFTFPLISGNPERALKEPSSLLITQKMAIKYFGYKDPVGERINYILSGTNIDFEITGILKNIPKNSHFTFDFLASLNTYFSVFGESNFTWNMNPSHFPIYIRLDKYHDLKGLEGKFTALLHKNRNKSLKEDIRLQPLRSIHLGGNINYEIETNTTFRYIYMLSLIALFIMLIACFNYMNLSTARSRNRSKEIGIRKVVGAERKHLIRQFLGESFLFSLIALIISILFVMLFLPEFNSLVSRDISPKSCNLSFIVAFVIIFTALVSLLSGSYPAMLLSSLSPLTTLKSKHNIIQKNFFKFRSLLVTLQFVVSISLIICTFMVHQQNHFIQKTKLGYEKEHLIHFQLRGALSSQFNSFKNELRKNPNILSVAASSSIPVSANRLGRIEWEGKKSDDSILWHGFFVDYDYLETLKLEMSQGRFFSKEFSTDSTNYVLNKTAVKAMEMEQPIGKRFKLWGNEGKIIGVVNDYNFMSLHKKIGPLILRIDPNWYRCIIVRLNPENITKTISFIEKTYKEFNPHYHFEYSFLNEQIDQLYMVEIKLAQIFNYFSFLAIFIACLGIFGMLSYITEQRTKEIGIRKVLGISVLGIVLLIGRREK